MSLIIIKDVKVTERLRVECKLNNKSFLYWSAIDTKYEDLDFFNYDLPKRIIEKTNVIEVIFDEYDHGIHIDFDNFLSIEVDFKDEFFSISNYIKLTKQNTYVDEMELFEEQLEEFEEEFEEEIIDQLLLKIPKNERKPLSSSAMEEVKHQTEAFKEAFKAEWRKEYEQTVMRAVNEIIYFTEPETQPKQDEVQF